MAMSPEVAAAVQKLIEDNDAKLRADLNGTIAHDGEAVKQEILAHRDEITLHRSALEDNEKRINELINDQNAKSNLIVEEVKAHKAEIAAQQGTIAAQQNRAEQGLSETQNPDARLTAFSQQLMLLGKDAKDAIDKVDLDAQQTRADIVEEFEFWRVEITKWVDEFKDKAGPPGLGGGSGGMSGGGGNREKGIVTKETAVWKIPEEVDKSAFRHWIEAVDM